MKGTLRMIIWFFMIVIGGIISIIIDLRYFKSLFLNFYFHLTVGFLGIIILWFVMRISRNTGKILAKYGRQGNIPRLETNVLVDKGPYKYMRHPMHFGLLFFPLGFGLLIGSPTFLLFFAPIEILFILLMIKFVEQPEAIKKFGQQYLDYIKDKPWFCISKKCLKELLKPSIEI